VSGDLEFMKDDPGRQTIGSFNPLTSDDWTDMAYVGNTAGLCQAICDRDVAFVRKWCTLEGCSLDRRDHTGRTPLQLAVQCSSIEVVRCLIDNGARIVARLVDGMTALHIAAWRGNADMIEALLEKSEANEEEEAEREALAKRMKKSDLGSRGSKEQRAGQDEDCSEDSEASEEEEAEATTNYAASEQSMPITEGSFVKVQPDAQSGNSLPEDKSHEPDFYDVNVLGRRHAPFDPYLY
jgi:ankyrin repeat protein